MSRIMQDAARILDALDEGIFCGLMMYLEHHDPSISRDEMKEKIIEVLQNKWTQEKIKYWIDWFGFNNISKEGK